MTTGTHRRRSARRGAGLAVCAASVLMLAAAGSAAAASPDDPDALTPQLAAQIRACLRTVRRGTDDDALGLRKVSVVEVCPGLAVRLGARPLPGMRGRWFDEQGRMTLRQLDDLQRIVEGAAEPRPFVGQLSSIQLAAIIEALDPAARGELSTRARLSRWWRAVVGEFDPTRREQGQKRRRIDWPLGFWSSVSWTAFAIAALLVATIIFQEIRNALAPRPGRRRRGTRREARRSRRVDLAALDALPPRERAGAMLRAVAWRLHESGALPTPDPLTPREVHAEARLAPPERAALAVVTAVAESGAYGRDEPASTMLSQARQAAARWLVVGAARRWAWPGSDRGRTR